MLTVALFLTASALNAGGVELHVQYTAIQKVLAQQMFTDEGRFYVSGTRQARCSFAYLENPAVGGSDGRVQIVARYRGKSATSLFGLCLGMGDEFDLRILAAPFYQDGMIRLRDVSVETQGKNTYYARKVRTAITENLAKRFEYRVSDEAKKILEREPRNEPYQQQLTNFQVSAIRVSPEALVLQLEFTLVVK